MDNLAISDLVDFFKRVVLWVITSIIFSSAELKDEAFQHVHSGVVRIPGVCYGLNLVKGYQAIGEIFPLRCRLIRLDYILGYAKVLILFSCIIGIFLLMAKILT